MKSKSKFYALVIIFVGGVTFVRAKQVNLAEQQIAQQQVQATGAFLLLMQQWQNASKVFHKDKDINPEICCKKCGEVVSLGVFEGYMIALASQAIAQGLVAFEQVRKLLEKYIQLLSHKASVNEIKGCMTDSLNAVKQLCFSCKSPGLWVKE